MYIHTIGTGESAGEICERDTCPIMHVHIHADDINEPAGEVTQIDILQSYIVFRQSHLYTRR